MTAPRRILFIVPGLDRGGPELRLLEFARRFPPEIELHVCATSNYLGLLGELEKTPAKILLLPVPRAYLAFREVRVLARYVARHQIEIVNSFGLKALMLAVLLKAARGRRLKLVHHFVDLLHDVGPRQTFVLWRLMRFVDGIVCNANEVRERVLGSRRLAAAVSVIPNGVDTGLFTPDAGERTRARAALGIAPDELVVGTLANLRPEKNYPFLIDAFARLRATRPKLRLLAVGGGPLLGEMRELVRRRGLEGAVNFTGYVEDVRRQLAAMDVFVLCSLQEGFPNALLQASAMQLPVVCAAVGECPLVVDDGESGLLFDPRDQEAFLRAVTALIDHPEHAAQLGRAARRRIERTHGVQAMIDGYLDCYRRMLG